MRAAPAALDASDADAAPLTSLIFEPLVRFDESGTPQPCLAVSWQHEGTGKRWKFTLRPGVKLHDGSGLAPASVASSLTGMTATAASDAVVIRAEHGIGSLLLDLARSKVASTGPFRVVAFEPGRRVTLTANEDYWGGRPILDSIEVQMGRALRDQFADLELGKTDVIELGPADVRRGAERGRTVWSSAPVRLIALAAEAGHMVDPRLREALALSIDRAAMHSVLLQKQGEASAAILPQWISGYAFVFPAAPDLARAKALVNAMTPASRAIALTYDPGMPAGRALADRIAVNARDAGLTIQVSPQNKQADVRLVERRLHDLDPARALASLPAPVQTLYESERKLLEDFRVIPLFHLPDLYGASSRVRVYAPPPITRLGEWRFDNLWLSGTAP
jgi:peptide/nickel transport system substrate-binding protein